MKKTLIIGEIGSNYGNSLDLAREYIKACKRAGADAAKFQTIKKNKIISHKIYVRGEWQDNPIYKIFASLELPDDWHFDLKKEADAQGIEFLSTPFYLEAVDLLEKVGVKTFKVASGDITFTPLLEAIGKTHKKVILSTGASDLSDVEKALNTLTNAGAGEVTLLHCVSNYPPKWDEMNLMAMVTLKEKFQVPVGISDHTPGATVPLAAVALGASVIEKHITFDRALGGPDHPFAMTIAEFTDMIAQVRNLELALGDGKKIATPLEMEKQYRIRRGVYSNEILGLDNKGEIWLRPQHKKD